MTYHKIWNRHQYYIVTISEHKLTRIINQCYEIGSESSDNEFNVAVINNEIKVEIF